MPGNSTSMVSPWIFPIIIPPDFELSQISLSFMSHLKDTSSFGTLHTAIPFSISSSWLLEYFSVLPPCARYTPSYMSLDVHEFANARAINKREDNKIFRWYCLGNMGILIFIKNRTKRANPKLVSRFFKIRKF